MRLFASRELRQALDHAAGSGQALHVHRFLGDRRRALLEATEPEESPCADP